MLVLHANWSHGSLHLWAESADAFVSGRTAQQANGHTPAATKTRQRAGKNQPSAVSSAEKGAPSQAVDAPIHPFAAGPELLINELRAAGMLPAADRLTSAPLVLKLPADQLGVCPSDVLAQTAGGYESTVDPWLAEVRVTTIVLGASDAIPALSRLRALPPEGHLEAGASVRYWSTVADFVVDLLADQRFVPTLAHRRGGILTAAWHPWLHDADARERAAALLAAMPPVCRALTNGHAAAGRAVLDDALRTMGDQVVRDALAADAYDEAIQDADADDPHVAWLGGLLSHTRSVNAAFDVGQAMVATAGQWLARLTDDEQAREVRLCLHLHEPDVAPDRKGAKIGDVTWRLSFHLQSGNDPEHLVDAEDIWAHGAAATQLDGQHVDRPQDLLLAELSRAARLYPKLDEALSDASPTGLGLTTAQAYQFLREAAPLLEESGIGVIAPEWWNAPGQSLGLRLIVQPDEPGAGGPAPPLAVDHASASATALGLSAIVQYKWQVAVGDYAISPEEFAALARSRSPLVQVGTRWVEIKPEQMAEAAEFLEESATGRMSVLEAMWMAHGLGDKKPALPVLGLEANGWVAQMLRATEENHRLKDIPQPESFKGSLRPYQNHGLSWLAFLDSCGLGACLADDMGLGKTIQLIALLLWEREAGAKAREQVAGEAPLVEPTLLIVPTSVMSNWTRELSRFAPNLKVHLQHGPDRLLGDRFTKTAVTKDVVITTYPLVSRDIQTLKTVQWRRVVLDEAQYIKNPPTKQTTAIRSLPAKRRVALTGTPVENRLSELWSIMEFCNPGFLGPAADFRRRFALPIERHRDARQTQALRQLVRPFILRRVKSDPKVISDLPPCVETREFATLTPEQAGAYETVVNELMKEVDRAAGMQRRGMVLAALVRLKQICDHPALALSEPVVMAGDGREQKPEIKGTRAALEQGEEATKSQAAEVESRIDPETLSELSRRSGKARRLLVLLDEIMAAGEKALVFTQFRQMGHLLAAMIQHDLGRSSLFLHGGTPAARRQGMIDKFQAADGQFPVFILSLKAGGLGLNLTAANHVFHFDRWWNPAVEAQATDRAFRIGQTRTVHVHKFVCVGTLEERIDQMIEQKSELARNIVGAGEQWLTELSAGQLRDLLSLRSGALENES